MNATARADVTQILHAWSAGDADAPERLMPIVYDELRPLATSYLMRERSDHKLQPTALVHEVYLRLADQQQTTWKDRAHFCDMAARSMRQSLVGHARATTVLCDRTFARLWLRCELGCG